jgi:hypothetical protein
MNHSHPPAPHNTRELYPPNYCPFDTSHPPFYSLECPTCNHQASEEYKMEMARLTHIRKSIDAYFQLPNIGELTLDNILSNCMARQAVKEHLAYYDEGSIEYYMQQAKVIQMIKQNISAYIDGKMTPQE